MAAPIKKITISKKSNGGKEFPLYDSLFEKIKDKKESEISGKIWSQMSKLDLHNAEIVYYLILHYARINGNNDETPYTRKIPEGGKGVIYDVDNLPGKLKLILAECLNKITNG